MSVPSILTSPLTLRDVSVDPDSVSLFQSDDLGAVLGAGAATLATILSEIGDCERLLNELSALLSLQDPTIRQVRHTLSHALLEAGQFQAREATLRKQLGIVSEHQERLERNTSGLRFAIDRFLQARDESLRTGLAAPARIFLGVAYGARMAVRKISSLFDGTIGQGTRIGIAWLDVWERLRAGLVEKDKANGDNLDQRQVKEEKGEKED